MKQIITEAKDRRDDKIKEQDIYSMSRVIKIILTRKLNITQLFTILLS